MHFLKCYSSNFRVGRGANWSNYDETSVTILAHGNNDGGGGGGLWFWCICVLHLVLSLGFHVVFLDRVPIEHISRAAATVKSTMCTKKKWHHARWFWLWLPGDRVPFCSADSAKQVDPGVLEQDWLAMGDYPSSLLPRAAYAQRGVKWTRYIVREFYQIFGKSGNKFPTKKFLHQYVC